MNTPTPRTDSAQFIQHDMTAVVSANLARTLELELAAEREKTYALRLACERIVAQWDENHDCNPIGAGGTMYTLASKVLAATE